MTAYRHIIENCLAETIGEGGLEQERYRDLLTRADGALDRLCRARDERALPYLSLPHREDDLPALEDIAEAYRARFDDVLVLGTGGSALGGKALWQLADRGFGPPAGCPRLHVLDNVDPRTFDALFARLDMIRTGVIAISKSGGTAETLCQSLVLLDALRARVGESRLHRHFTVITEPKANPLRQLAERFRLPVLEHDPDLGGRFAVLSAVGALPALIQGLDVRALRAGAAAVVDQALSPCSAAEDVPSAAGAAIAVGLSQQHGIDLSVLFAYSDRLQVFTRWHRQLWAESLGKDGKGLTPIDALGTVDQHSQMQLYLDGPRDKLFTLLDVEDDAAAGREVQPELAEDLGLGYLAGRTMGDLFAAEIRAAAETLAEHRRPLRRIRLPHLDEAALGALFQHFMLETAIAADLLGVNAYDQPAVEGGKRLTREYLAAMETKGRFACAGRQTSRNDGPGAGGSTTAAAATAAVGGSTITHPTSTGARAAS